MRLNTFCDSFIYYKIYFFKLKFYFTSFELSKLSNYVIKIDYQSQFILHWWKSNRVNSFWLVVGICHAFSEFPKLLKTLSASATVTRIVQNIWRLIYKFTKLFTHFSREWDLIVRALALHCFLKMLKNIKFSDVTFLDIYFQINQYCIFVHVIFFSISILHWSVTKS